MKTKKPKVQVKKPVVIRTNLLKFIISKGMSVREFCVNAERTRLREKNNLIKVEQHVQLWKNYGWL